MSLAKSAYDEYGDYEQSERQSRDARIGRVTKGVLGLGALAAAGYGVSRLAKHMKETGHATGLREGFHQGIQEHAKYVANEKAQAAAATAAKQLQAREGPSLLRSAYEGLKMDPVEKTKEQIEKVKPYVEKAVAVTKKETGELFPTFKKGIKKLMEKRNELSALEFMKTAALPVGESIDFGFMQFSGRGRGPMLDAPLVAPGESVDANTRKTWMLHPLAVGTKVL